MKCIHSRSVCSSNNEILKKEKKEEMYMENTKLIKVKTRYPLKCLQKLMNEDMLSKIETQV